MKESKKGNLDPKEQFVKETILSLENTIQNNKDGDDINKELTVCLKKAFSKVATRDYAAYWRKLDLWLTPGVIEYQSPQLHQLLLTKTQTEGPPNLQSLLIECKEIPKPPQPWEVALEFMKYINSNNKLKINIDKSPRPIKWLMKTLNRVIEDSLALIQLILLLAMSVILAPLWLIRMSANSVLNGITGDAYKKAVLGTAKALNLKEVLFYNRKNKLLSDYEDSLNSLEKILSEGNQFQQLMKQNLENMQAELNGLEFNPTNPNALYVLNLHFDNIGNYRLYKLNREPNHAYIATLKKDADNDNKHFYDDTMVFGPYRLYLIAKALFSSILSPLPAGFGNKFMHIVFIRPVRLILTPILLGLHMAIETSLSVPVTLFGLFLIIKLVARLAETVLNIPYDLAKGISSLVFSCCKKGEQEEQDNLPSVPNSNVAKAFRKTPGGVTQTDYSEPPHYLDPLCWRLPRTASTKADAIPDQATYGLVVY